MLQTDSSPQGATGPRILLVDDDAPSARVLGLTLELKGYVLDVSSTRTGAVEMVSRHTPQLIIMDYLMTDIPPGEFIDRVRGAGFGGPILLCTAMTEDVGLPVDQVIRKPFDPDELVSRVETLLGGSQKSA